MREQQRQLVKAQEQAKEAKEQARKWEREAKVACTPIPWLSLLACMPDV
jgi:hypothetical protein